MKKPAVQKAQPVCVLVLVNVLIQNAAGIKVEICPEAGIRIGLQATDADDLRIAGIRDVADGVFHFHGQADVDVTGDIFMVARFPVDLQSARIMEVENTSVEGAGSCVLRTVIAERCPGIGVAFQIRIGCVAGAVIVDGQLRKGAEIAVFIRILRFLKEVPCACGGGDGVIGALR